MKGFDFSPLSVDKVKPMKELIPQNIPRVNIFHHLPHTLEPRFQEPEKHRAQVQEERAMRGDVRVELDLLTVPVERECLEKEADDLSAELGRLGQMGTQEIVDHVIEALDLLADAADFGLLGLEVLVDVALEYHFILSYTI